MDLIQIKKNPMVKNNYLKTNTYFSLMGNLRRSFLTAICEENQ
jgi:hypothetical protein